jgi:multidrug resistance efflux pump
VVEQNEVLATLDTREIDLEALRFESQRDQARLKQQDAEGKHDRAQAAVFAANAAEADAQAALARDKSARARIVAPYRGLVISGDLSQQLGSPVERGKVLFEVAPLDHYRVAVQVDERDLSRVAVGQPGRLVLNGLSADALNFAVNRIVPVSVAGDGGNTFRVEGELQSLDPRLRPGMEGVGKIVSGEARLIWSWTRPMVNAVRLFVWKWLP